MICYDCDNHSYDTSGYFVACKTREFIRFVWELRLWKRIKGIVADIPMPDPPPQDTAIPLNPIISELNKIHEIETLRAKYVRRVHVDPKDAKTIGKLCRDTADLLERIK